ncbi:MAG: zinc-ribbon and DUF3426 domain-containing protein [Pseudomonadota bacterium]|nr:zinc-ribbon and DUF3426 domain-containing protein [Pseudomonadota bacterium]
MSAQKTQCPFCESIFAVTPEQLAARGGHVRCGKCFQVFKADDYIVNNENSARSPELPPVAASQPLSAEPAPDVFDLLNEKPPEQQPKRVTLAGQKSISMTDAELGQLESKQHLDEEFDQVFAALSPQAVDPNQSYAQSTQAKIEEPLQVAATPVADVLVSAPVLPTAEQKPAEPVPDQPVIPASPIAVALPDLDDANAAPNFQDTPPPGQIAAISLPPIEDQPIETPKKSMFNKTKTSASLSALKLDGDFSDLFLGGDSGTAEVLRKDEVVGVDKIRPNADESWAEALLNEEDEARKKNEQQQAAELLGSQAPPSVLAKPKTPSGHQDSENLLNYLNETGAASEEIEQPTRTSAIQTRLQQLPPPASHRIRIPEKTRKPLGYFVLWGGLCIIMLLLLAAQWAYFNFANLASQPQYHNKLAALCQIVGCQLPLSDADQIHLNRIQIRPHPEDRNVSRVTLRITNRADQAQLLPKLHLLITERQTGEAERMILPAEYLQAAERSMQQLRPNQTLQAQFDIQVAHTQIRRHRISAVY